MEIWKDIPNYNGLYQASSLGRIKSLSRVTIRRNGSTYTVQERILNNRENIHGYFMVVMYKEFKSKNCTVHSLIAQAHLNHKPCGYKLVVNHINFNKKDNRVQNLEIVTNRENSNKKHLKSSSKYLGVSWHKRKMTWQASFYANGKAKHLGYFKKEIDAHFEVEKTLNKNKHLL